MSESGPIPSIDSRPVDSAGPASTGNVPAGDAVSENPEAQPNPEADVAQFKTDAGRLEREIIKPGEDRTRPPEGMQFEEIGVIHVGDKKASPLKNNEEIARAARSGVPLEATLSFRIAYSRPVEAAKPPAPWRTGRTSTWAPPLWRPRPETAPIAYRGNAPSGMIASNSPAPASYVEDIPANNVVNMPRNIVMAEPQRRTTWVRIRAEKVHSDESRFFIKDSEGKIHEILLEKGDSEHFFELPEGEYEITAQSGKVDNEHDNFSLKVAKEKEVKETEGKN